MPIYLIRHGQSEFNAAHMQGRPDPMIWDAPLTALGCEQARQVRAKIASLGIQQVLTTPLTRAIQTAKLIFDGLAPITIIPHHRELLTHSCDVGASPAVLRNKFPELSFDGLPDVWWYQGPENKDGVPVEPHDIFQDRIDVFADLIAAMSVRPLAIVGHGNVFNALAGFEMSNCEVKQFNGERPTGPLNFC
ncbi:MAG: histidine phosphatase family protein [Oceanospirillaceae bacterium]|nr:histidine phosphatase family protein [Oceanospirillaceae bacterium]